MIKLGFLIANLGAAQLVSSLIISGNKFVAEHPESDVTLFQSDIAIPCLQANFSIMDMAESYAFDGATIATDVAGAEFLLKSPGPFHKILYLWNLEWVYANPRVWENCVKTYANEKLDIIVRSAEHARALEITYGVKAKAIIPNGNVGEFYDFVKLANKPLKRKTYVEGLFYKQDK